MRDLTFASGSWCLRRVFCMDGNCTVMVQSTMTIFQRGGSKPEVVFRSGSPCFRRVLSMDSECLRVTQSVLVVAHIKDHARQPLPVRCRHGGKRLESSSHTSHSTDSSKNPFRHTWNHSRTIPHNRSNLVRKPSKTTDPTSPFVFTQLLRNISRR